jgi:hypothetical protein
VDLNHRPPGPEPGALARLRYAPTVSMRKKAASCRDIKNSTGTAGPTRPHLPILPIKPLAFTYSTNARPPEKLAPLGGSCLVFRDSKIRTAKRTASRADWWTTAQSHLATCSRAPCPLHSALRHASSLVVQEKEEPVFLDRASERASKYVANQFRRLVAPAVAQWNSTTEAVVYLRGLYKVIVGAGVGVPVVLVSRSVKGVRAAFGH